MSTLHNLVVHRIPSTPTPSLHTLTSCVQQVSVSRAITMNTFEFEFYSNTNTDYIQDVASAPWFGSPRAMGDCPSTSMPQSTHSDLMSTSGCLSAARKYVPDFNPTEYEGFTLVPTTEMVTFTNLPTTQGDYAYQVSNQHVRPRLF